MGEEIFYIYLANDLGFSLELLKPSLDNLVNLLENIHVEGVEIEVIEPFKQNAQYIPKISMEESYAEHERKWNEANDIIYAHNQRLMNKSSLFVAILNGADADPGVASETAKYSVLNLGPIIGYRDDFRLGENIAARGINIEVRGSVKDAINKTGGSLVSNLTDLEKTVKKYVVELTKKC